MAAIPPLQEQSNIACFIESKTKSLNLAIIRTEREIALLREYRTRLTADVVTGKVDVREAVKRLPAQAEEPLPVEDLDVPEDEDEIEEEA
jgi:type I restriction enzyme S subunit